MKKNEEISESQTKKNDENMEMSKIEEHLHEQYAINNNSKLSTIVTFIVAIFAVFGAYGYVYLYTSPELPSGFRLLVEHCKCCNYSEYEFTLWALFIVAVAVYFVLWIIFHICIYQGSAQRGEQFITFAIRHKAYKDNSGQNQSSEKIEKCLSKEYNKIFPEEYHPFGKSKATFIQGLYGEIIKIIHVCSLLISISLIPKILYANVECCDKLAMIIIPFIIIIICILKYVCYKKASGTFIAKYYKKYKRRNDEYVDKLCFSSNLKFYNKQQNNHEKFNK
jgi:hypothetical protein